MADVLGSVLIGAVATPLRDWTVEVADDAAGLAAYHRLRHDVFVAEQGLFAGSDRDDVDDDPRTVVLVARTSSGDVLGGVRIGPVVEPDVGWWHGGRLAVRPDARRTAGLGGALVRAACAHAERLGALRFEATVQAANVALFLRLGWRPVGDVAVAGHPHVAMRWPVDRFAAQARATKGALGALLAGLHLGGPGFVGDDGAPVPGTDVVAACDAIVPSLVERDPAWAGWCGVLVNVNDLAAMGAEPLGLLDAVGARDASFAARVISGLRAAATAWDVPVLGGHTQFGVPAALSVTALGRAAQPVPAGGGRAGDVVSLTADLGGGWRPGHTGRQWDSTSIRRTPELRAMGGMVARTAPAAAKDVSMAGVVGTLGMLAEASGCGAVLDVAAVPTPAGATTADWLGCFPGFAMLTADGTDRPVADAGPAVSAACGELVPGAGVALRWPDGAVTTAVPASVTGLGPADGRTQP
ncbi:putative N-acetyltransferase, MSMEG_0567 N-terminal domain family [Jatrophihabitans endophyticus]|uniref:Putative N-acetyltransferase, MSMEG_0567 N-terminal domain family n=1 Tax=Jatrophihabitans endophyticus TaxID=1206085 RepID=A0A1M5TWX4_9ACTN|nr:MSMEG_0567/sll0787 family protein [Jatrophihabitans endophyticus]SHH55302.1 putative N-acetyltransferase, MSMEG_0567 N-terminal domain family [Jatrophihabitans endophyticus]